MSPLLIGLTVFGVAIVAFLAFIAARPSDFTVSRSTRIAAPPEVVFHEVNSFHRWEAWSPWAKLDPQAQNSFSGPDAGEGATFSWSGNNEVGEGTMTIVESKPADRIRLKLSFNRPMKDTSDTLFTFVPSGRQTEVTWTMSGRSKFIGKLVCFFMNMDKMVGGKFEEGLASMKAVAEAKAAKS